MTILTTFAFNLAVRFKVLPAWGIDPESGVPGSGSGYAQVPGGQRAEAERRRCVRFPFGPARAGVSLWRAR